MEQEAARAAEAERERLAAEMRIQEEQEAPEVDPEVMAEMLRV